VAKQILRKIGEARCSVGMFRLLDRIVGDACRDGKHVTDCET